MDSYIIESNGKKVRIKAFDFLKLYAIFLVLWGHSIQYFLSSNYYDEPIYRIIYSFHMPLFMMISGYFSLSSMSLPPFEFLKKKFVQLILPVISWCVVLGILAFCYTILRYHTVPNFVGTIVGIINGFYGPYPFWFLKSCFFCYLLTYCGVLFRINRHVWMLLSIIISQLVPYFVSNFFLVDIMYPCFVVGIELKDNHKFYSHICRYYWGLLGLFILMLCFWDKFFWGSEGIMKTFIIDYMHITSSFFLMIVSKLYRLIIGIAGSLSFLGLICSSFPQEKTNKFISICCNWGQYTLGIYILQSIILETYMAQFILLDDLNFYFFNFVVAPIISFFVLVLCVYIIKTMNRSRILAFLFFGNYKTRNI